MTRAAPRSANAPDRPDKDLPTKPPRARPKGSPGGTSAAPAEATAPPHPAPVGAAPGSEGTAARLGFCCTFIPEEVPGQYKTLKAAKEAAREMNLTIVTMANLARLGPAARAEKLGGVVRHNLAALGRQIAWVATRPPLERLLRMASSVLPGYTHPVAAPLYAEPELRTVIETGLARLGEQARAGGVRLSMHPGPFCIIASRNPSAQANGIAEFEYHTAVMTMMGYGEGWHPHGAHLNIHIGGREPGIDGFRENLRLLSGTARNLLTVENDEYLFGLDAVLRLGEHVPIVFDIHHHWVESRGAYLGTDDPRIPAIQASWRGVRPVSHVSVSRESLLGGHDSEALPDFVALSEAGHSWRDLAAHSDLMWNAALNRLIARHLAWSDFEIEAKSKNLASVSLAEQIGPIPVAAPGA